LVLACCLASCPLAVKQHCSRAVTVATTLEGPIKGHVPFQCKVSSIFLTPTFIELRICCLNFQHLADHLCSSIEAQLAPLFPVPEKDNERKYYEDQIANLAGSLSLSTVIIQIVDGSAECCAHNASLGAHAAGSDQKRSRRRARSNGRKFMQRPRDRDRLLAVP
jgi:hypothetical protein